MWTVKHSMPHSEMEARYKLSAAEPRYFHVSNPNRESYLGHEPGWMIHHGNVAYGPFDYANDPPMKRNAYIEYSVWNTVYDQDQRYAGGKYAMQSDGSDTLAEWVKADRPLMGKDIVTWFSAGFHHIPRMEDWPVMSTEWKTVHIMPHNFFAHNPALSIRK
ncbi:Cu2+-containing amine oxidase [Sinorhizobium fredii]